MLCQSFTWQIIKTRVIGLRVIEGPNARDQIAFSACHSFLVEDWKFKRILATYMRRMRNSNLEIKIAGYFCRPQLIYKTEHFLISKITAITFQYRAVYSYGTRYSKTSKQNCLTTVHINLSIRFRLSKMSWNETPSWYRSQNSAEYSHRQAKVRRFLGICLCDCFTYRSNLKEDLIGFIFYVCACGLCSFNKPRISLNRSSVPYILQWNLDITKSSA